MQRPQAQRRPRPRPRAVPTSPAVGPAHLGVAADAARRVSAGLGAHAQRARTVKAQAAGAGRQESRQVLVAREILRWPKRRQSQPEEGTISECSEPTGPHYGGGRRSAGPCRGQARGRDRRVPRPRAPHLPGSGPRRCERARCGRPVRAPHGRRSRAGRRRRRGGRARARRPRRRGWEPRPRSATSAGRARSGRGRGRRQRPLCARASRSSAQALAGTCPPRPAPRLALQPGRAPTGPAPATPRPQAWPPPPRHAHLGPAPGTLPARTRARPGPLTCAAGQVRAGV